MSGVELVLEEVEVEVPILGNKDPDLSVILYEGASSVSITCEFESISFSGTAFLKLVLNFDDAYHLNAKARKVGDQAL